MARQRGPNYITGRIGNLIYYKSNGVYYVKAAPNIVQTKKERERRMVQEGRIEFGGGSVMSKAFRDVFAAFIPSYSDRAFASRLTGVFRRMIGQGAGEQGMRDVQLSGFKGLLAGFQFHSRNVFEQVFRAPLSWEATKARRKIVLKVPGIAKTGLVKKPAGATHFRINLAAGVLQDHVYSKKLKRYQPVDGKVHEACVVVSSGYIGLKEVSAGFELTAKLKRVVPAGASVVLCVEICFYMEENGIMYAMKSKQAMKVLAVL